MEVERNKQKVITNEYKQENISNKQGMNFKKSDKTEKKKIKEK